MTTVTFVGTGAAFSRRFGHSNALVEKGDVRLMLDFGYHAPARLEKMGIGLGEITHVAVSHLHADHTGGLEELAFVAYFSHGTRPCLLLPEPVAEPLWDRCLSGGLAWISDDDGGPLGRELSDYFEIVILEESKWSRIGNLEVKAFAVDHVPGTASFGFLVRDCEDGCRFVVSGDVRSKLPELLQVELDPDFAAGPIFHDCQLFDGGPSSIHLSLDRIKEYPEAIRERLVLTHYGDRIEECLPGIEAAGLRVVWPSQPIRIAAWKESLGVAPAPRD